VRRQVLGQTYSQGIDKPFHQMKNGATWDVPPGLSVT
jgi:hypothetical protein